MDEPVQLDHVQLKRGLKIVAEGFLKFQASVLLFHDPNTKTEIWIEYMTVQSASKRKVSDKAGFCLEVFCKDFRKAEFIFRDEQACATAVGHIETLSLPDTIESLDAFHVHPKINNVTVDGWALYDAEEEYRRMGVPCDAWRLATINEDYELCPTYSRKLFVPSYTSDEVLRGSAKFRSKGRLPALSFRSQLNQCCISRSSQPYSGVQSKRSEEDEKHLQAIYHCSPHGKPLIIVDTRPKVNAMANKAAGKGFENMEGYANCKLYFHGIQNIHVMRDSLNALLKAVLASNARPEKYIRAVNESGWLKHIQTVLLTALNIVDYINRSHNVLVHCSDGWDRTAQTCSLSSLLLDPHYRTIRGYIVLIEKEWLSFGHKFMDRHGFIRGSAKETSPVFLQFLECTWHCMQQFPQAFEFNTKFLITIHDCLHSCKFGTFLGNCDQERDAAGVRTRTRSAWTYIYSRLDEFRNFYYDAEEAPALLRPDLSPQRFELWREMYCRWDRECLPKQSFEDAYQHVKMKETKLREALRAAKQKLKLLRAGKDASHITVPEHVVEPFEYGMREPPRSLLEQW